VPCRLFPIGLVLLLSLARLTFGQSNPSQESKPPKVSATTEVTASRNEESISDAPVSISVIGQKQIETSPADNYADLLRGLPGLNVVQTSARDIGIRSRGSSGVAEHRQLTLLDGRSIYLDFYGVVLWDFLPVNMDEIKQIEVLRGPGSALWGPNALSGVINLRTKSPRELKGGLITVAVGERGTREVSVRWAQAFDRFSYKASTSYFEQNSWKRDDTLPDGSPLPAGYGFEDKGTRQPKADLRFDWGAESGPLWSYKLGYGGTTGIFHSRLGPFLIQPGTYVGYAEVDRSANLLDVKAYWNRLRGDAPNLINGLDFAFGMDTYAGEFTDRRPLSSKQLLVYGASVRASRFNLSIAPRGVARNEAGLFLEESAILHRNVSGMRERVSITSERSAPRSPLERA
jgi:outer membrane receptor protein involved in Fe transport